MNTKFTIESLAAWIKEIKEAAEEDFSFSVAWFPGTTDTFFSIVAGWQKMPNLPEEFCISKSRPEYVMSIKVAINEEPYVCVAFDKMNMPLGIDGNVDNTCIPLERNDLPEAAAEFFLMEWERIMKEHGEEIR